MYRAVTLKLQRIADVFAAEAVGFASNWRRWTWAFDCQHLAALATVIGWIFAGVQMEDIAARSLDAVAILLVLALG